MINPGPKMLEAFGGGDVPYSEVRTFYVHYVTGQGIYATFQCQGFLLLDLDYVLCYGCLGKLAAIFPKSVVNKVEFD